MNTYYHLRRLGMAALCSATAMISACTKGNAIIQADAVIKNEGPVAADGCDWTIVINSRPCHPDNLGSQFKQDNMKVNIQYTVLSDKHFGCGMVANNPGLTVIHLNSIKKD